MEREDKKPEEVDSEVLKILYDPAFPISRSKFLPFELYNLFKMIVLIVFSVAENIGLPGSFLNI